MLFVNRLVHTFVPGSESEPVDTSCRTNAGFAASLICIGLNITLPHEQAPNPYMCPELAFRFHYFALRKMHFLLHAKGLVAFPGGYGTLDELFEVLTLIQTGRMKRIPFILFGTQFWHKVINWQALADAGTISPEDLDLISFVETADEAVAIIDNWEEPCP